MLPNDKRGEGKQQGDRIVQGPRPCGLQYSCAACEYLVFAKKCVAILTESCVVIYSGDG